MGVVHKVVRKTASFESQMAANRGVTPSPTATLASPPPPPPTPVSAPSPVAVSKYPRFGRRGAPQAFPSKLYEILEGENPDIIGWTATGRGFEVRDHARLSSEVLGRFFKQDKFSSFQRQLNLYGFRKITKGTESGSYQHPHFRRGERTTLLTIRRSTKASPARVVEPTSPASAGASTPPAAVPLGSNGSGAGTKSKSFRGSSRRRSNGNMQPRSATPSPPPASVFRGAPAWPRLPLVGGDGGGRGGESSPVGSFMSNPTTRMSPGDRQQEKQQLPCPVATTTNPGWGSSSYAADQASAEGRRAYGGDAAPATAAASVSTPEQQEREKLRGGGGGSPSPIAQQHSALDHQDAEVVSLLQRMAKEAQDSPSRKRAALAAQNWENGQHLHDAAAEASSAAYPRQQVGQQQEQQHLQHLHQPEFKLPGRPAAGGTDESEQAQGRVRAFRGHLFDLLNHGRGGGAGYYPVAFGADGSATSDLVPLQQQQYDSHQAPLLKQQQQQQHDDLPSPHGTASPSVSSPTSSDCSSAHLVQLPPHTDSFQSVASTHRPSSSSSSSSSSSVGDADGGMRGDVVISAQDRQSLLARCRSGPSSSSSSAAAAADVAAVAAAAAAAAEQDRQILLARSRSGPSEFNRDDDHRYFHLQHHHKRHRPYNDAGFAFDRSPSSRSPVGGRVMGRGDAGYSFEGTRYGWQLSSSEGGVLPPLPSLNFEQFNAGGNGKSGGGGGGKFQEIRRAPWHMADSAYV